MSEAKQGDRVSVHYTGRLDDGTEFDSSRDRSPLEFTIGEGQVIPGFEEAVVGMDVDDSKTISIPAAEAYGDYRQEMVFMIERTELPPGLEPEVGQRLQKGEPDGSNMVVTVVEISQESVTLDANHPLAGKDLTFDIQLTAIA